MEKIQCPQCGRTLFECGGEELEIKCNRCKHITKFKIKKYE